MVHVVERLTWDDGRKCSQPIEWPVCVGECSHSFMSSNADGTFTCVSCGAVSCQQADEPLIAKAQ